MGIIHKNPTEESFIIWLSNHPESFHSLDMQRFYTFAKNVNSHHAKRWFDKRYFKSQIRLHIPKFEDVNIDYFYEQLLVCRDYHNSVKTPLIDINDDKWYERTVMEHAIKDEYIEDINQYFSKGSRKR